MKKTKIALTSAVSLLFSVSAVFAQWSTGLSNASSVGLPQGTIYNIIQGILYWLLAIFGFVAVIGFLISGIMYLVSSGDDDAQEKAKNQMKWSIIGVIVGLVGLVVLYAVDRMLRVTAAF